LLVGKSLDVSRTVEKADFQKKLRISLELYKEQKLNGLLVDNGASTPEATSRLNAAVARVATAATKGACRLKRASAPPSYGQVLNASKVYRCEGNLASVRIKLVIFTLLFCTSAECSSLAATASLRRRQRSGHKPVWAP
jgi:hypothetical protein